MRFYLRNAGKLALHGLLPDDVEEAVFALFDACNFLWQKNISRSELEDLVNAALPLSELDMNLHLLKHIAEDIHLRGPPWATSAFVYERMWGRIIAHWLQNVAKKVIKDWAIHPRAHLQLPPLQYTFQSV